MHQRIGDALRSRVMAVASVLVPSPLGAGGAKPVFVVWVVVGGCPLVPEEHVEVPFQGLKISKPWAQPCDATFTQMDVGGISLSDFNST